MPAAEARELRARVVGRLDALQAEQVTRRATVRRWRAAFTVAAVAAMVPLCWLGVSRLRRPAGDPTSTAEVVAVRGAIGVAREGDERPLPSAGGARLAPSDELRTGPDALARASLPTGARVEVGPSSRLRFERGSDGPGVRDRIDLLAGRIDVKVPKLTDGDEVRVHAGEADVVVHGTMFSVERTADGSTRVAVTEGKVAVYSEQGERMLTAGAVWALAPAAAATAAEAASPPPAGGPGQLEPSGEPSTLRAENALLAGAMRLEGRHGDQALAALDDLLTRYPGSPLAETARLERLRVLAAMGDRARLKPEVAAYLADYPKGFGRKEAGRLLETTKASAP